MKQILLVFCSVLVIFSLTACNSSEDNRQISRTVSAVSNEQPVQDDEPVEENSVDNNGQTELSPTDSNQPIASNSTESTMQSTPSTSAPVEPDSTDSNAQSTPSTSAPVEPDSTDSNAQSTSSTSAPIDSNSTEDNTQSTPSTSAPVEPDSTDSNAPSTSSTSAPIDSNSTEDNTQSTPSSFEDKTSPKESTAMKMNLQIGDSTFTATLEENSAVESLLGLMETAPLVIQMSDYSAFEKVGTLGVSLPTSNLQTTTQSGDIVLYNGNQIVIFYGTNSWSYTRLGKVDDLTGWKEALGNGDITVTFSIA